MAKQCNHDSCTYDVFGGGYCPNHQYLRKDGKAPKPIGSKGKKIKQVSDKRAIENRVYTDVKEELKQELIKEGEWKCFFSGISLEGRYAEVHHIAGKKGYSDNGVLLLTDKENLVWCLPKYHSLPGGYHTLTLQQIAEEPYFDKLIDKMLRVDKKKANNLLTKLNHFKNEDPR